MKMGYNSSQRAGGQGRLPAPEIRYKIITHRIFLKHKITHPQKKKQVEERVRSWVT
jgi:hypothetical protein